MNYTRYNQVFGGADSANTTANAISGDSETIKAPRSASTRKGRPRLKGVADIKRRRANMIASTPAAANQNDPATPPSAPPDLRLGDCLEVMKTLPAQSVHLILADPPYGCTGCPWDNVILLEAFWDQCRRILTPRGAVVLTATQPFTSDVIRSNPEWFKYSMVWEKTKKTGFQHAKLKPLKAHEDILVFSPGTTIGCHASERQMTYNPQGLVTLAEPKLSRNSGMGRTLRDSGQQLGGKTFRRVAQTHTNYQTTILRFASHSPKRGEETHPTQKPVPLFAYLVLMYSNPGETVLDHCMGSGTTGVACGEVGDRHFIGIERDPEFFALAEARISGACAPNSWSEKRRPDVVMAANPANDNGLVPQRLFERAPSPLRYAGGKSRAIELFVRLILAGVAETDAKELVAPFLGGGNIEVTCANEGIRVFGSDIFEPVVCFWRWLLADSVGLAKAVKKYVGTVNESSFPELKYLVPQMPDCLEKAAACYSVFMSSRNGQGFSGRWSGHNRLTWEGVEKVRHFSCPNLSVETLDYRQALRNHPSTLAYLDPPYEFSRAQKNCLYGINGDAHRGFDHQALFQVLSNRLRWIVSYNADPHILNRYAAFEQVFPFWSYGMTNTGRSNEVLIFSPDLAHLAVQARHHIEKLKAANDNQRLRVGPPKRQKLAAAANDNTPPIVATPWDTPDLSVCDDSIRPAPPFPSTVLGGPWTEWCGDVAAGANAPFDYVAMSLVTAAAGLIGNSVTVSASGTFIEPAILWTCLVGESGAGKTPAMNVIRRILDRLETPEARRRLGNVSVAAATKLSAENPKGLLVCRDELSGLWTVVKRTYGEDFWLEAWNGQTFSKDRMNAEPLFVDKLSISIVGGAQPDIVKDITTDNKNRGFSARWLFVYPDPTEGYGGHGREVDVAWSTNALRRLKDLPVALASIPLTEEGRSNFDAWWNERRRANADEHGLWGNWLGKQSGNALRVALCLELLKWCATGSAALPQEIATQTLGDAIALIDEWAIPMAERTLHEMSRCASDRRAAALARHLRRYKLTTFNARRLWRGEYGPAGVLGSSAAMAEACRTLEEASMIRHSGVRKHQHKGRVPTDYEVNPALLEPRKAPLELCASGALASDVVAARRAQRKGCVEANRRLDAPPK